MNKQKVSNLLGLAQRAGKIISGEELVIKSVQEGKTCLVFLADDAAPNLTKKITDNKKKSQETKDKPQISEKPVKKDAASKQRKTEKTSTKSRELSGQMSLFDLL